mmetsp:Transcript_25516/g.60700  ORF Transcript_25516/g.60700 Transcript_25516/m.60700 type:complete len:268 (+) Transcript_25516:764-1567(+)
MPPAGHGLARIAPEVVDAVGEDVLHGEGGPLLAGGPEVRGGVAADKRDRLLHEVHDVSLVHHVEAAEGHHLLEEVGDSLPAEVEPADARGDGAAVKHRNGVGEREAAVEDERRARLRREGADPGERVEREGCRQLGRGGGSERGEPKPLKHELLGRCAAGVEVHRRLRQQERALPRVDPEDLSPRRRPDAVRGSGASPGRRVSGRKTGEGGAITDKRGLRPARSGEGREKRAGVRLASARNRSPRGSRGGLRTGGSGNPPRGLKRRG